MDEEKLTFYVWTENSTNICYSDEDQGVFWCGNKDKCMAKGLWLPWINESLIPWQARAVLYLIGLLYRYNDTSNGTKYFM